MAAIELLPDFTPLNPAEREVLGLLAQGHTAKSIATLTGKTEGSVNERLREARRKTGVASSRELARLLAESRKNRDEQIGVGESPPGDATKARRSALRGPRGKGIIAMAIFSAAVLTALLLMDQQTPPSTTTASDPMLGNSFAARPWPSPAELHARLRGEGRDEGWAAEKEAAIRAAFISHARLERPGDSVRVVCRRTLCEVAVTMQSYSEVRASRAVTAIQDTPLRDAMASLGLVNEIMSFGNQGDAPSKPLYVSYWRRR